MNELDTVAVFRRLDPSGLGQRIAGLLEPKRYALLMTAGGLGA